MYSDMRDQFHTIGNESGMQEMLPNSWSNCRPLLSSATCKGVLLWKCTSSVVSSLSETVFSIGALLNSVQGHIKRFVHLRMEYLEDI